MKALYRAKYQNNLFTMQVSIIVFCLFISGFLVKSGYAQVGDESLITLKGHTGSVNSIFLMSDGERLISGSSDSTVIIWDLKTNKIQYRFTYPEGKVMDITASSDNRLIISGGFDKYVRLHKMVPGAVSDTKLSEYASVTPNEITTTSSRTSNTRQSRYRNNTPTRNNPTTRTTEVPGFPSNITSVAFTTSQRYIASGQYDNTVRIWDRNTQRNIRTLEGHEWIVRDVAFSPDNRYLVSAGANSIKKWSTATWREADSFDGHKKAVTCLAFDYTGRRLVSGGEDGQIIVWDFYTGDTIRIYDAGAPVYSVAIARQKYIASGDGKNLVKIWNLESESDTALITFNGHWRRVNDLLFTTDDSHLISASEDGLIKFWYLADIEARIHFADEIAKELANNPQFSSGKGEFENETMYRERLARQPQLKREMYDRYLRRYLQEQEEQRAAVSEKVRNSYKQITLKIEDIGYYNAETEKFPVKINGQSDSLHVPIAVARSFKENYKDAKITADKQLGLDGKTWEVFNIKVEHPVTGAIYEFGTQHQPYYMQPEEPDEEEDGEDDLELHHNEDDPFYDPDAKG